MDETAFHITKVMPKMQFEGILEVEGICPICQSRNVLYQTEHRCNNKVWQNHYLCKDCSTEWVGNSYTEDFKRTTQVEEKRTAPKMHPLLEGMGWLIKLNCCSDIYSL